MSTSDEAEVEAERREEIITSVVEAAREAGHEMDRDAAEIAVRTTVDAVWDDVPEPESDGSIHIRMRYPPDHRAHEGDVLVMRRLVGKHIRKASGLEGEARLLSWIASSAGLPPSFVDAMDAVDISAACEAVGFFMDGSPRVGRSSPQT